ncbi:succinate dehydrogenase, cytochrome b556 subunit [Thermomonas sp.]|uniref:succinate dehydrogenase, cytochrome b556 subunit n=1 Tax=Thermomonas sp. TaxID=1971895 RepID=UPI0024882E89|nr:succinate dehydrogenase, cytochrome b556 subunit [Thermomonas sp.]MDI1253297.1 succinate dehydrogenase, cytochrome b556 subunit [Thermomonas sp.]
MNTPTGRLRPRSPNIQFYRPQLTSVLSIVNRMTGVVLSVCAVALVIWLVAAAAGPHAYLIVHTAIASSLGQMLLFLATFAFFMHLCGSLRHLVWDTVHSFSLRAIYLSGWIVFAASVVFTITAWVVSAFVGR